MDPAPLRIIEKLVKQAAQTRSSRCKDDLDGKAPKAHRSLLPLPFRCVTGLVAWPLDPGSLPMFQSFGLALKSCLW